MGRLLLPALIFGSLIYWIFGAEMLRRHRDAMASARWIGWVLLGFELLLFGFLLARLPILRSPPAMLIGVAVAWSLHYAAAGRLARAVRERGWIDVRAVPAGERARGIDEREREAGRLGRVFARNHYILVVTAYLIVIVLVLVMHRVRSG